MKRKKSHHHIMDSPALLRFFRIATIIVFGFFQSCQQAPEDDNTSNTLPIDSLDYYTNLIATDPMDDTAMVNRARLFYHRKAYDAALKDLQSSLSIDSTRMETYLLKSQVEMDYFRSMDALRTLRKAENRWPESGLLKEHLAQIHLILKQYEEAQEKANQALKINPLSAKTYLILGMVAKENQDTTAAIKFLRESVQNDADLLDSWIELARLQMERDPAEAAPYFESALQVAPKNLRIWHAYAMYWQNQDSLNQAKNSYSQIIEMDSNYLEAYYNKALLLMDQDSFRQAIPLWGQYIRKTDEPAQGHYYRGISYEMTGNFHSALENYQTARELDPKLAHIDDAIQSMENKLK